MQMHLLQDELENLNLNDNIKESIINFYTSYLSVKNNHIFIEDKHHDIIAIGHRIIINNKIKNNLIDSTKTIFLSNCSNIKIILGKKINHLIIERCKNVKVIIMKGLISGLDIIHSSDVNIIINNDNIYNLSCGDSSDCDYKLKKDIASNTLFSTDNCHNINLIINDTENNSIILFKTNESLFTSSMGIIIYKFEEDNNILLYSMNNTNGFIQPN